MPYSFLSHPAEIKILVKGENPQELFRESLKAMFEIISGQELSSLKGGKPEVVREIKISSLDRELLLADFLSEALTLSETNKELYFDCEFKELSSTSLLGYLYGLPLAKKKEEIKGVTYHDLKIENKEGIWQATILFDV